MVNHDNSQHAKNENLRLANLWQGIDMIAALKKKSLKLLHASSVSTF